MHIYADVQGLAGI